MIVIGNVHSPNHSMISATAMITSTSNTFARYSATPLSAFGSMTPKTSS
jgi:hypothetical protein